MYRTLNSNGIFHMHTLKVKNCKSINTISAFSATLYGGRHGLFKLMWVAPWTPRPMGAVTMVRASHPAQPSPAQRESWQQVDSGHGGDSQSANPANQLQSKCQGREMEMEMNVSKGSGGRLWWVRGCGPVCVAAAGWRDLLATVETSARCSAVGGHRAVVTLPPLLPHHLHTATPHVLSQPAWCLVSGILCVKSRSSFHQTKLAHF